MHDAGSVVHRYRRFRFTILTAVVLVASVLAYPVIPASQSVHPDDFQERRIDARTATVVVHFENHLAMSMFDGQKAEDFVNSRFQTDITVDKRGIASYEEFVQAPKEGNTVHVLFTNWNLVSWNDGHEYTGLAVPAYGVFFVAGHSAFKMVDGQYMVFAHEMGHMLEGPEHSPFSGNLMSQPIGGDRLCDCEGDPYRKWVR